MSMVQADILVDGMAAEVPSPTTMAAAGTSSLQRGEIETRISQPVARTMTVLFLLGIFCVPLFQAAYELLTARRVQAMDLARPIVRGVKALARGEVRESARAFQYGLTREHLASYEKAMEDASWFKQRFGPRVQLGMTRYGGFGNVMVVAGREGWLYYQLGLDYVGGPGFLEIDALLRRRGMFFADGVDEANADPRPAIIAFHERVKAAGGHLVFVPVPVKEMVEAGRLGGRLTFGEGEPLPNNRDYEVFADDLRKAGVDVFDAFIPRVASRVANVMYLKRDTHWRPEWMEAVAKSLADHVRARGVLSPLAGPFETRQEAVTVEHVGDLVEGLKLPGWQRLYPAEQVVVHRVIDARTGEAIASREDADVLVLGDSFSNIYSAPEMKWGESAGLPYQLVHHLQRPVEMVIRNGGAATEVRREALQRGRLRGKRVVIWQVAMHELVASEWALINDE